MGLAVESHAAVAAVLAAAVEALHEDTQPPRSCEQHAVGEQSREALRRESVVSK